MLLTVGLLVGTYALKRMVLSKEIVTKTVRNGLGVDVLVDTGRPDANEILNKTVTLWSGAVVDSMQ